MTKEETEAQKTAFKKLWKERIMIWLQGANIPAEHWGGIEHACWIAFQERTE